MSLSFHNELLPANSVPSKKVLILGINGCIGRHLLDRILTTTNWEVYGIDIDSSRIDHLVVNKAYESRIIFKKGDMVAEKEWVEYRVSTVDVLLPLAAIALPSSYVKDTLSVFELDFEANLHVVRLVHKYRKRLIFPSTSEVYGMCQDKELDPQQSTLVCGPIHKSRWIYSCSKQLLGRLIWAYGKEGLEFTLFRPFNWIGPGLDSLENSEPGSSRVVTQFLGHIIRGENIALVDGGSQC